MNEIDLLLAEHEIEDQTVDLNLHLETYSQSCHDLFEAQFFKANIPDMNAKNNTAILDSAIDKLVNSLRP